MYFQVKIELPCRQGFSYSPRLNLSSALNLVMGGSPMRSRAITICSSSESSKLFKAGTASWAAGPMPTEGNDGPVGSAAASASSSTGCSARSDARVPGRPPSRRDQSDRGASPHRPASPCLGRSAPRSVPVPPGPPIPMSATPGSPPFPPPKFPGLARLHPTARYPGIRRGTAGAAAGPMRPRASSAMYLAADVGGLSQAVDQVGHCLACRRTEES